MKFAQYVFAGLLAAVPATQAAEQYIYDATITSLQVYANGEIKINTNQAYYDFKADATTDGGKNLLALLLTAQASRRKIAFYYEDSDNSLLRVSLSQ